MTKHFPHYKSKNILFAVILIFVLALAGFGISTLVSSRIPLWLLLGFSVIFSIEKWFNYYTRKYKIVGRIYRLILNLSLLSLLGLLIWSGFSLFTQQFMQSPLVGSLLFLVELVFFIWLFRVISKNSWRQPSMKLTVFSLICLFLIFSFAGVQPIAGYKDKAISTVSGYFTEMKAKSEAKLEQIKAEEEENRIAEENVEKERLTKLGINNVDEVVKEIDKDKELKIGIEVVELVNAIRKERGSSELLWDDKLYEYSLAHTKDMASERRLFHTDMDLPYGENAWGGEGSKSWTAQTIVESWMTSEKHRTWLLCPGLKHVAVGVAYSNNGMYSSWTFWRRETTSADFWYQYTPDNPPKWWY